MVVPILSAAIPHYRVQTVNLYVASFGKASNSVGSGNYYFGRQVSGAGDFNGDGDQDILIGNYYHSSYRGQALLFLGPFDDDYDEADADHDTGGFTYDNEAQVVREAGDYDDDGYDDLLYRQPVLGYYRTRVHHSGVRFL